MKKILFCTKYDRLGASSRLRTLQFIPYLKTDYACQINSLFSNDYVRKIYSHSKQSKLHILWSFIKRFFIVILCDADLIIIEKELFPYLPYFIEKICLYKKKYIIDMDDAVFHNYDQNDSLIIKLFFRNKFELLFKNAFMIWAGSNYIYDFADKFNPNCVQLMPTVVDLNKYVNQTSNHKSENKKDDYITIGWIGTTESSVYLDEIIDVLLVIAKSYKIKLRLIGTSKKLNLPLIEVDNIEWSELTEVEEIHKFDIGIMPLADTMWARGKCAYKLIQYMACSKAVVASNIGENAILVENGLNGFLCSTKEEWSFSLEKLILDKTSRINLGYNGRATIESRYSLHVNLLKMKTVFDSIK